MQLRKYNTQGMKIGSNDEKSIVKILIYDELFGTDFEEKMVNI